MKKRTGPRSFMDLVPVRESGVPVRRKTDRYSQTVITCCNFFPQAQFASDEERLMHTWRFYTTRRPSSGHTRVTFVLKGMDLIQLRGKSYLFFSPAEPTG